MSPFGLKHKGYNNSIIGRNHNYGYGFNGEKEEQNELGLNWIDYGARNYDASLGRWFSVDNMTEEFYDWTPYKYGMDNPINYTDPDGNCETCWEFIKGVGKSYVNKIKGTWHAVTHPMETAGNVYDAIKKDPWGVGSQLTISAVGGPIGDAIVNDVNLAYAIADGDINGVQDNVADRGMNLTGDAVGFGTGKALNALGKVVKASSAASKATNAIDDVADIVSKDVSKMDDVIKSKKPNVRKVRKEINKSKNPQEKASDQFEGITRAQEKAKKAKKGFKQNKINSTKKSKQNDKHQLNRIDINNLDNM